MTLSGAGVALSGAGVALSGAGVAPSRAGVAPSRAGMTRPHPRKVAGRSWAGAAAAVMAMAMIGAGAGSVQAASTAWTVTPSPNVTLPGGTIESVSCSAQKACTAVGRYLNASGINVTLAERWNGMSWRRQATPNPSAATAPSGPPDLLGVSCPSASFCAAVGSYQPTVSPQVSLAYTWNGTAWASHPFPVPANSAGAGLTAVSCTSSRSCEAVGSFLDNTSGTNVTLAARWNGTAWTLQPTPNPSGFNFEQFNAVSCASRTFCEAWASGNGGNPGVTIAEKWNGSSWRMQSVSASAMVNSVSCTSATFCEAVGSGPAYRWNGSAWTAQTISGPASTGALGGVSCVSAASCEAAGEISSGGNVVPAAAGWNGSAWRSQSVPNPAGGTFTHLNAVSCVSPSACETGGFTQVQVTSNDPQALAGAWNGKAWRLQHAAAPGGATLNSLTAVSCASASFCEAAGTHFDAAGNQVSLMEGWNGKAWRVQAAPSIAEGVSCVSASFCEAVGAGPVAEEWNGTRWRAQKRPGAAAVTPQVVSCASTSFCMSVDGFDHVETWNGSSWSAAPAIPGFSGIGSVSCLSAAFCEVAGGGPAGQDAAVWNGTSWTDQATPGGPSASLNAVWCTSASSCEAVGQIPNQSDQPSTLAESWNGSAWSVQPTPNPTATQGTTLSAVSCTSATSCTAAGQFQSSGVTNFGALQTLVEVWDGTAWSLRSTPDPGPRDDLLSGVSCGASQVCTAVGRTEDAGGVPSTLIETGD